jgi:hypothetical protein
VPCGVEDLRVEPSNQNARRSQTVDAVEPTDIVSSVDGDRSRNCTYASATTPMK